MARQYPEAAIVVEVEDDGTVDVERGGVVGTGWAVTVGPPVRIPGGNGAGAGRTRTLEVVDVEIDGGVVVKKAVSDVGAAVVVVVEGGND